MVRVHINPLDVAPMIFTDGSTAYYKDYMFEHIKKVEEYSKQILNSVSILDSELISIIDDILILNIMKVLNRITI